MKILLIILLLIPVEALSEQIFRGASAVKFTTSEHQPAFYKYTVDSYLSYQYISSSNKKITASASSFALDNYNLKLDSLYYSDSIDLFHKSEAGIGLINNDIGFIGQGYRDPTTRYSILTPSGTYFTNRGGLGVSGVGAFISVETFNELVAQKLVFRVTDGNPRFKETRSVFNRVFTEFDVFPKDVEYGNHYSFSYSRMYFKHDFKLDVSMIETELLEKSKLLTLINASYRYSGAVNEVIAELFYGMTPPYSRKELFGNGPDRYTGPTIGSSFYVNQYLDSSVIYAGVSVLYFDLADKYGTKFVKELNATQSVGAQRYVQDWYFGIKKELTPNIYVALELHRAKGHLYEVNVLDIIEYYKKNLNNSSYNTGMMSVMVRF